MVSTRVRYDTRLPVSEAFAVVTAWERHRVPFTRISVTETGFIARTGPGPWGFDDPMEITCWDPPRRVDLDKRGRVILGSARIEVEPTTAGSVVTWTEDARIAGVPRWCDPVVRRLLAGMISLVLRRLFA